MSTLQNNSIEKLVGDVRNLLTQARQATARAINTAMVTTYWMIGQRIVVEEQNGDNKAAYGQQILQKLSSALENWQRILLFEPEKYAAVLPDIPVGGNLLHTV